MKRALHERWQALAGGDVDALGTALCEAWNEPQRHYHGVGHLVWLLDESARRGALIADHAFVGYAIWFHDAIYQPGAPDNEDRSAAWARETIVDPALGERVGQVIVLTKNHSEGVAEGDAALFLDMDFAILGAPAAVYRDYVAGVRREFSMIPDEAFAVGRGRFLQQQLGRERIFRTEVYEGELGDQARANMSAELERLQRPG